MRKNNRAQAGNFLQISTICKHMRFCLSFFLMIFLPLQSAWAVAAPYCGHENSALVSHFGHHAHEHDATDTFQDSSGVVATGGIDADCAPCNGVGSALVMSFNAPGPFTGETRHATSITTDSPLPPIQRPERPKWQRLA